MKLSSPQRRKLLSETKVIPVVYNYDSVLVGSKNGEWQFPSAALQSGETPEEAARRICDEHGIVAHAFKEPITPEGRSNVHFVMCSYSDGQPLNDGGWNGWNWLHPDHVINNHDVAQHDREFLQKAPSYLGFSGPRPPRSVSQ